MTFETILCIFFSSDTESNSVYDSDNSMELSSEDSDDNAEFCESDSSSDFICIDKEWRLIAIGLENVDPICVRLNELIRRGKISKQHIFYKYVEGVVEFYYDPRHEYREDVVEFFDTLSYLSIYRGPMFSGQGRGCFHSSDIVQLLSPKNIKIVRFVIQA